MAAMHLKSANPSIHLQPMQSCELPCSKPALYGCGLAPSTWQTSEGQSLLANILFVRAHGFYFIF
jgi:hypothetical protein